MRALLLLFVLASCGHEPSITVRRGDGRVQVVPIGCTEYTNEDSVVVCDRYLSSYGHNTTFQSVGSVVPSGFATDSSFSLSYERVCVIKN